MLKLDGKTLNYDVAFSHNDINYPANWLRFASLEEKNELGITEVADPPWYDQRFYWGAGNPKDHEQLVETWVAKVKKNAGSLLSQTDWMVIREADSSSDQSIPDAVVTERALIRAKCDEKEAAIEATTTTEELAAYVTGSTFNVWEDVPEPEPGPSPEPVVDVDYIDFNGSSSTTAIFGE